MNFLYLDEVDSTNQYGKREIDKLVDKTVISAKHQTAGRGRLTRAWLDLGEGNIFATIILKPSDKFDEKFANLTQYLSVVLCKTFEKYGLKPEIKWPNDVLIDGKKIAGILSETVMQGSYFKGLVLGFGVNISAKKEDVERVVDKEVTSLFIESGKLFDSQDFLSDIINMFFENYEEFLGHGFEFIKHDYISRVNFLEKNISVKVFNDTLSGIAQNINDSGALVLRKNEEEFVLTIGDIL